MPNDADKIAAATLAAAMVRRLEPTGSIQEDIRARERAIEFASRLYRDLLAAIEATSAEEPISVVEPVPSENA